MKKSVLFFIALSITTALFAQQPFGLNATWHIDYFNLYGFNGFYKISYSHDTIINNESWQMFNESGVREIRTGPKPNDIQQWVYSGERYRYKFMTRNDTVFRMTSNGAIKMLYDFGAQVGDVWQFAPWDTSTSCIDTPQVTVTAIGYDTINGQVLKYWKLRDEKDTINGQYRCSSGRCMGGKVYENIGAFTGSVGYSSFYNFSSAPNICNGSFSVVNYNLRCFNDDSLNLKFYNKACDYWAIIGIEENNALSNIKIYPNPATNFLRLSGMENVNEELYWKIMDLSGRVLLNGKLDNETDNISIQNLSGGMYILELDGLKSLRFLKG